MNLDLLQSILRMLANSAGGILIARGYTTSTGWEQITGGLISVAALLWSAYHQRKMKSTAADAAVTTATTPPK